MLSPFQNVVVVVTAVEGDTCHKSLTRLKADVLTVGALDMFDKAEVVRQTLAAHRKALDETPFNNQVSQSKELLPQGQGNLAGKRELCDIPKTWSVKQTMFCFRKWTTF